MGGRGEEGHHADRSRGDGRQTQHWRSSAACQRPDDEEGRDLAADETHAHRDRGEEEFERKSLGPIRACAEGLCEQRKAKAEGLARADCKGEQQQQRAARGKAHGKPWKMPLRRGLDAVREPDEAARDQPHPGTQQGPRRECLERHGRRLDDRKGEVANAEPAHRRIARQRSHERDRKRLEREPALDHKLNGKNGAREGGAEDGPEAAAYTRKEHEPAEFRRRCHAAGDSVREASAHLQGGALAARAAANEVGKEGAEQNHGGEAARERIAAVGQRVDDAVGAPTGRGAPAFVGGTQKEAADGEQPDEPEVAFAEVSDRLERHQKEGYAEAAEQADEEAQRHCLAPEEESVRRGGGGHEQGSAGSDGGEFALEMGSGRPNQHGAEHRNLVREARVDALP